MNLIDACKAADIETVANILKSEPYSIHIRDETTNKSPLHFAAEVGAFEVVKKLLESGHAWNEVTFDHKTAAEFAKKAGFIEIYNLLKNHGIQVEYILSAVNKDTKSSNDDFLTKKLTFSNGVLLDQDGNGVMMNWEFPLMEKHAKVICKDAKSILNIGFGLGIIDSLIQSYHPEKHVIIEAHPDVYAKIIQDGWLEKPGVQVLFGKWQDFVHELDVFDGIFFDTFGEDYSALKEFHEIVPNILSETGVYSFFNGLAGTNEFFHDVYCNIAQMDLEEIGLSTEYVEIDIGEIGDEIWQGIARKYWTLEKYNLPICRLNI